MMNEKDNEIRKLFDEYADGLESRPELSGKARERMTSRSRDGARGKRTAFICLASIAGAAASVAVCIFAVNTFFNLFDRTNGGHGNDATPEPPTTVYTTEYDIRNVRAVSVSRETVAEYFDISAIESRYNVFDENYYACYLKDSGELVYFRGSFGMETENGTTQVGMIAEKADYRRTDLKETFANIITDNDRTVVAHAYIDGEYISQIYLGNTNMHYYVTTMGNDAYAYNVATDIIIRNSECGIRNCRTDCVYLRMRDAVVCVPYELVYEQHSRTYVISSGARSAKSRNLPIR